MYSRSNYTQREVIRNRAHQKNSDESDPKLIGTKKKKDKSETLLLSSVHSRWILSPFMMKILCPLNHLQTGWSPIVPPLTLQPIHNLSNPSSQLKKSFIIIINSSDQLFG